jgi:adenine phosphoribosyltransferase
MVPWMRRRPYVGSSVPRAKISPVGTDEPANGCRCIRGTNKCALTIGGEIGACCETLTTLGGIGMDLRKLVRDIPDFPKKGIVFRDIMPMLGDAQALRYMVDAMFVHYFGQKIDKVVSAEARGFIFGPAVAYHLGAGFVAVRKPGKLPHKTRQVTYDLEYGTDSLTIHEDALKKGDHVLLVDDLLATGGTMAASAKLCEDLGAKVVGAGFIIELSFLKGREKLKGYDVFSLINYESE